jgi:hypothetical protein
MALVDRNGRIFGRVNLIDAALFFFIALLLPIGFTAYRVFRIPLPIVDTVQPADQPVSPGMRVRITGHNFRPYLRAFVLPANDPFIVTDGGVLTREALFLVESPEAVQLQLPKLGPGVYDIHLVDQAREIWSRRAAFTLTADSGHETITARVTFVAHPEVIKLMSAGDTDVPVRASPEGADAVLERVTKSAAGLTATDARLAPAGRNWLWVQGPLVAMDGTVRIPVTRNVSGVWMYKEQPVRPGETFSFETTRYAVRGLILSVSSGVPSR